MSRHSPIHNIHTYPATPRTRASTAVTGFWQHQPSMLCLALALGYSSATGGWGTEVAAQTLPTGAQAIAGSASLAQNGNNLTVTTTNAAGGNHSAINWQSFSVGKGYGAYFSQPSAASTSINRVVTQTPSQIFGTLSSNGKLVLVNQAGIAVGAGALVDTAGFTATTLGMAEADAKAGILRFNANGIAGDVNVQGRVISRGGDVVLIAPNITVDKDAVVEAPDGAVVLAAGRSALITGRGMEGVLLQVKAPADTVLNLGQLTGDAVGLFAGTLKHSGAIAATGVTLEGGKVRLFSSDSTEVSGSVSATKTTAAGQVGGDIAISSANHVMLRSGAVVDASGAHGGGTVSVGGGWQGGRADVVNALSTQVEQGAQIKANATVQGDGGSVAIWSDGTTTTHGNLQAKGAGTGGSGGQVETSGHTLIRSGIPDVRAGAGGKAGTWLLDPDDVIIALDSGTGSTSGGTNTIYESEIEAATSMANVSIAAKRSVKAQGTAGDQSLDFQGYGLKITTTNTLADPACPSPSGACGIDLTAFTNGIHTNGGSLDIVTGYDSVTSAATGISTRATTGVYAAPIALPTIDTGGYNGGYNGNGGITISGTGDVTVGDISTIGSNGPGGHVNISAANTLHVGNILSFGDDTLSYFPSNCDGPCDGSIFNGGSITLEANRIVVDGDLLAESGVIALGEDSLVRVGNAGSVTLSAKGVGLGSVPAIDFTGLNGRGGSGLNIISTAAGGPNAGFGSGAGMPAGDVSIVADEGSIRFKQLEIFAKGGTAYDQSNQPIVSGSTNVGISGQGSAGGRVTLSANNAPTGALGISGERLNIDTRGGQGGAYTDYYTDPYTYPYPITYGRGGAGGSVTIHTNRSLVVDREIDIQADGGAGSMGGAGAADVLIEGLEGISARNISITATGGHGWLHYATDPTGSGVGGAGGNVTLNVGSGALSIVRGADDRDTRGLYVDVSGGDGSGDALTVGAAGNGGHISLIGTANSWLNMPSPSGEDSYNGMELLANGGYWSAVASTVPVPAPPEGGPTFSIIPTTAPTPSNGGSAGKVKIELGSITLPESTFIEAVGRGNQNENGVGGLGGDITLRALAGDIDDATVNGYSDSAWLSTRNDYSDVCVNGVQCHISLEAPLGAITLPGTSLDTNSLHLQADGDVHLVPGYYSYGSNTINMVDGIVGGDLDLTARVSSWDTSFALGTAASAAAGGPRNLTVSGIATLAIGTPDTESGSYNYDGLVHVPAGQTAHAQAWKITSGGLRMGDSSATLQADDYVALSTPLSWIRLSGADSTSDTTSSSEFLLSQNTLERIDSPLLRINGSNGADIMFSSPTGEVVDFKSANALNPNMTLSLSTEGQIYSSATPLHVHGLVAKAAAIDLNAAGNQIDRLSAQSTGRLGMYDASDLPGTISVSNAGNILLGEVVDNQPGNANVAPGLLASGRVGDESGVQSAGINITSTAGAIFLGNRVAADRITLRSATGIFNAPNSNGNAWLDTRSETSTDNFTTITLLSDGDIGTSGSDGYITVKPGGNTRVLVGDNDAENGSPSPRTAALYFALGEDSTTHSSRLNVTDSKRSLFLASEGGWSIDNGLTHADSIELFALDGDIAFTTSGLLQADRTITLNADAGAISGNPSASTAQATAQAVLAFAQDGIDLRVNTQALAVDRFGENTASINIHNTGTDPMLLVLANNSMGDVTLSSQGRVDIAGSLPVGGADAGKPMGVNASNVSITSANGINVHRSVVATGGNVTLDASEGELFIAPQTPFTGAFPAPEVHVSGNQVALSGASIRVMAATQSAPTTSLLSQASTDAEATVPVYPVGSLPGSASVKITADAGLTFTTTAGVTINGGAATVAAVPTNLGYPVATTGVRILADTITATGSDAPALSGNARMQATQFVQLNSDRPNIRITASPTETSTTEYVLNQGSIERINAPVLRLDNFERGEAATIAFDGATTGTVDFNSSNALNPNMRLSLNTQGQVTQSGTTALSVDGLMVTAGAVNLSHSSNRIDAVSAQVFGREGFYAGTFTLHNNAAIALGLDGEGVSATGSHNTAQPAVNVTTSSGNIVVNAPVSAGEITLTSSAGSVQLLAGGDVLGEASISLNAPQGGLFQDVESGPQIAAPSVSLLSRDGMSLQVLTQKLSAQRTGTSVAALVVDNLGEDGMTLTRATNANGDVYISSAGLTVQGTVSAGNNGAATLDAGSGILAIVNDTVSNTTVSGRNVTLLGNDIAISAGTANAGSINVVAQNQLLLDAGDITLHADTGRTASLAGDRIRIFGDSFAATGNSQLNATSFLEIVPTSATLRVSPLASGSDDAGEDEFVLNQNTIARINAPVLRLNNAAHGTNGQILFDGSSIGGMVDFKLAVNPNMTLSLNTGGMVQQTADTSVRVAGLVAKAGKVELLHTGNQIDKLSAQATGGATLGFSGQVTVVNDGDITIGGVADTQPDHYGVAAGISATGRASESITSVQVSSLDGSVRLGDSVSADFIGLSASADIVKTSSSSTAVLNASSSTGGTSIDLRSNGAIGADNPGKFIAVMPGSGRVFLGQHSATVSGAGLEAALHMPVGTAGTANTSRIETQDNLRNLTLSSQGGWLVDGDLSANALSLVAHQGDITFGSGALTAQEALVLDASNGAIAGNSGNASAQATGKVVAAFANGNIGLTVNAQTLALERSDTNNSGFIQVNNLGTARLSLAGVHNANGSIDITSQGAIDVNGSFPPGSASEGMPLGLFATGNIAIAATGGLNVHRSIVSSGGDITLSAGNTGALVIAPQTPFVTAPASAPAAPPVHIGGRSIALSGQSIAISATTQAAPMSTPWAGLETASNESAPVYPTLGTGHFGAGSSAAVRIEGLTALTLNTSGDISLTAGDSAVALYAPSVTLNAGTLQLAGGAATNAYAAIEYGSGGMVLNVSGTGEAIRLTPGTGQNADAIVFGSANPSGTTNYANCTTCVPDWTQGQSPRSLVAANRGIGFGVAPVVDEDLTKKEQIVALIRTLSDAEQDALKTFVQSKTDDSSGDASTPLEKRKKADESVQAEICRS